MSAPDMEVIKEIPGYKVILKAVLKTQIQHMVEQLATHTDEESVILTASVSDGTLSHLGSDSGKGFLEDNEEVKSQFLGFCLKRHHKKQQQEAAEKEEKERERQRQLMQAAQAQVMPVPTQMGYGPGFRRNPRGPYPRPNMPRPPGMSPGGSMRSPSQRFEPYTIQRPQRNSTSSDPGQLSLPTTPIKQEPSEHSNDGSDTNLTKSPQVSGLDSKDDEKSNSSSASTIPNEQSEGAPAGEQGDSEVDPYVSVTNTMETVSESEMELDPNSGATGMKSDLQQNYTFKFNTKRKLICHTNETKFAALLEVERGQRSKTQIARQFNVPLPTLSGWVKNKQNIKESLKKFVSPYRKTSRKPNFQELDEKLYAWYCSIHGRHIQITNKVLRDKACCFAKDIGMKNYAIGLRSWTERFKARHGISFKHFKLNDSNSTAGHKSNNLTGLDSRNARESTARSTPIEVNRDKHSNSITGFKKIGSGILAEIRNDENTNNVTTVNAGIVSDSMPMNIKKEMLNYRAGFSSENIGEYLPMEYENIELARTVKVEPFMIKEEY